MFVHEVNFQKGFLPVISSAEEVTKAWIDWLAKGTNYRGPNIVVVTRRDARLQVSGSPAAGGTTII